MRKLLIATGTMGTAMLALAITKPLWFPESLGAYWHSAWLASPRETDERRAILEEHVRQLESLEAEHLKSIARARKVHKALLDEYTLLTKASEPQ